MNHLLGFLGRRIRLLQVLVDTFRTQRKVPVDHTHSSIDMGDSHHPAVEHRLPVQTLAQGDSGRREMLSDPVADHDLFFAPTVMAPDDCPVGHRPHRAHADRLDELVPVNESVFRVFHYLSPVERERARRSRRAALQRREVLKRVDRGEVYVSG